MALVEHGTVGGTCVNVGCVPSKALIRAAERYWNAGRNGFAGIRTSAGEVDLAALVVQKDALVEALRKQKYADLVGAHGFELIHGHATFTGHEAIAVDGRTIPADAYIVATGAAPRIPPVEGLEEAGYLTSAGALDLKEVPSSLAVIGAGPIGLELGQSFLHLGSRVTLFDVRPRIAPFEEPEVSEAMARILRDRGAGVHAPVRILRADRSDGGRHLWVEVQEAVREFHATEVLVATGRTPNTSGIGLAAAGVAVDDRGAILVDEHLRTTNPRVFAAGDCTPGPQFVYVAAQQGAMAAANALGESRPVDMRVVPRVTFTSPQIAAVGLTEARAWEAGRLVKTSVLPLSAVPRAIVNQDTGGLVKMVADAFTDELLGVSIVGEGAGEVIQAAALAIGLRLTVMEVADTLHPYLALAEGLKLAAQAFSRDVASSRAARPRATIRDRSDGSSGRSGKRAHRTRRQELMPAEFSSRKLSAHRRTSPTRGSRSR